MNKYLLVVFLLSISRTTDASYASNFPGVHFFDDSLFPLGNRSTRSGDLTPPSGRRCSAGCLSTDAESAVEPALIVPAQRSVDVQKLNDTSETAKE